MTTWDKFFVDKVQKIFKDKNSVLDIGGGLRIVEEKNNRYNPANEWIKPYLKDIDYKIMDPVDTYHPDIIGDIHKMPFADNTQSAIICLAVLEHVENPIKAVEEIYRVLKPGGYCLIYVPFLYYYHAEKGYYGDYWRFTKDNLELLSKPFSSKEIISVRGAIGTWIKLSTLGRAKFLESFWYFLDKISGKINSKQVSGYYAFLIK